MTPRSTAPLGGAPALKQCCARAYEGDLARLLLGDSFHPGGLRLTDRLGALLHLTPEAIVLDVASGVGASAMALAERYGCGVLGVDYGRQNAVRAAAAAAARGLSHRISFAQADAEALPLADASVDVVICECAFCTFPDKGAVAAEFARVLRPGGQVGLCDVTRSPEIPSGELNDLLAWIACLGDARPIADYVGTLTRAGLSVSTVERHDEALEAVVDQVRGRLLAAEVLTGLGKLDLPDVDFRTANRMARAALEAIHAGQLGYATIVADRM